jgi:hypothetical protein
MKPGDVMKRNGQWFRLADVTEDGYSFVRITAVEAAMWRGIQRAMAGWRTAE